MFADVVKVSSPLVLYDQSCIHALRLDVLFTWAEKMHWQNLL